MEFRASGIYQRRKNYSMMGYDREEREIVVLSIFRDEEEVMRISYPYGNGFNWVEPRF